MNNSYNSSGSKVTMLCTGRPENFERKEKFLLFRELLWGIWKICKRRLFKRAALSIGAPVWGTWRGFIYWDFWDTDGELWNGESLIISYGTEEEISVHVLCECEALASLRHAYLGSFFLDPEDIKKLKIEAIWNFSKGTGFLQVCIRMW